MIKTAKLTRTIRKPGSVGPCAASVVSVLDGVRAEGRAQGFEVAYSEAVRLTEGHDWDQDHVVITDPALNARLIADAVAAAKSADTILMALGDNEQTSREAWSDSHMGDRDSLDLTERGVGVDRPTSYRWVLNRALNQALLAGR